MSPSESLGCTFISYTCLGTFYCIFYAMAGCDIFEISEDSWLLVCIMHMFKGANLGGVFLVSKSRNLDVLESRRLPGSLNALHSPCQSIS